MSAFWGGFCAGVLIMLWLGLALLAYSAVVIGKRSDER